MKLSGTKTTTEEISVDASNLQNELQLQIADISDSVVGQAEFLKELQSFIDLQAVKIKKT